MVDNIIKGSEKFELNGDDILRIADNKCNVITYEQLEKYSTIDEVLNPYGAVVLLYETVSFNEGHWACIFKKSESTLEFFDSYGLKMDTELDISPDFNKRRHMGVLVPHLTALVDKSGYTVSSNTVQLQTVRKDINTCGRYTALRIRMRDLPLKKYIELLTKNKMYDSDFWVSALTILI